MESIHNQYDLVCKSCNHVNGHHEECTVENISFEQQLATARREGWEQGKAECVKMLKGAAETQRLWMLSKPPCDLVLYSVAKDIATMEYSPCK